MKKKNNNQGYITKGLFIVILIVFSIFPISADFDVELKYATPKCLAKSDIQCSIDKTKVEICNQYGSGFDTLITCASNEECGYADGVNKCVKKSIFPDINLLDISIRSEDVTFFPLLSLILAIIIIILWYLYINKNRLKNKEVRKYK